MGRRMLGRPTAVPFATIDLSFGTAASAGVKAGGEFDLESAHYIWVNDHGGRASRDNPMAEPAFKQWLNADDNPLDINGYLDLERDVVYAARLREYNYADQTLYSIIIAALPKSDHVYVQGINTGRAAFQALRKQYGGAGNSQSALATNLHALIGVTMAPTDKYAQISAKIAAKGKQVRDNGLIQADMSVLDFIGHLELSLKLRELGSDPRYATIIQAARTRAELDDAAIN